VDLVIIFEMGTNNKNDKKEYYDIDYVVLRLDSLGERTGGGIRIEKGPQNVTRPGRLVTNTGGGAHMF